MSKRLVLTQEARLDLIRLHDFICEHSPKAANRFAKVLKQNIKQLVNHPLLGKQVADMNIPELRDIFISFGQSGYVVRYHVTITEIQIIKIWSGRENR
jgi:toxin ParE1/3/4